MNFVHGADPSSAYARAVNAAAAAAARRVVLAALSAAGGVVTAAARKLGISRISVERLIASLDLAADVDAIRAAAGRPKFGRPPRPRATTRW